MPLWAVGMCLAGDLMLDVGIKERGRKMDQSLMFNARNFEG